MRHPKLIVLSAPSGCGKTTIAHALLKRHQEMVFSISATSRPMRAGEANGHDYFFLSKEEFEKKIANHELIEWEQIYGNYYGTLKSEVDRTIGAGKSMVFDIDVNGALNIKEQYGDKALLIFIEPPSLQVLTERLLNRKTENPESVKRRLDRVPMEMAKLPLFDFRVVNDNLELAISEVEEIVAKAEQEEFS